MFIIVLLCSSVFDLCSIISFVSVFAVVVLIVFAFVVDIDVIFRFRLMVRARLCLWFVCSCSGSFLLSVLCVLMFSLGYIVSLC